MLSLVSLPLLIFYLSLVSVGLAETWCDVVPQERVNCINEPHFLELS